ncbi:hypothetical protein [Kitasatospora sp. NPDC085464]|uniref:hypothetical protein n=1 Tax=Kitasatospora sp. NPDC085464 TaxID=3364063 RepID=UPI0037C54A65
MNSMKRRAAGAAAVVVRAAGTMIGASGPASAMTPTKPGSEFYPCTTLAWAKPRLEQEGRDDLSLREIVYPLIESRFGSYGRYQLFHHVEETQHDCMHQEEMADAHQDYNEAKEIAGLDGVFLQWLHEHANLKR